MKVRVAINCAVDSRRARLEERRSQGAKDDAPAILLEMDAAKKAAAVRMPLSLFPDLGGIRRVSATVFRDSACFAAFEHGVRGVACKALALALTWQHRKGPLLAVRNFAYRSDAHALAELFGCVLHSWHSRPARS